MNVTVDDLFQKIGVLTVERDFMQREIEVLKAEVEALRDRLEELAESHMEKD